MIRDRGSIPRRGVSCLCLRITSGKQATNCSHSMTVVITCTKQFLSHSMTTPCGRRDGSKGGRSCTRAGDFEQLPDGTGTVCFIYLMKKVDLSFQPFREGFFSLSWKCLTLPGSFLTVTHEIKIFINRSGRARTSLLSVLLKQEASDDWKSWQPVQADMKYDLLSSVIQIRTKDQVQL